jgi:anti-anti-sigma factor
VETFRIKAVPSDGICTLVLSGEADLAVSDDIVELGALSLDEATTHTLTLDLAAVTFIDSTTLGALVRLHYVAADQDKKMILVNVPRAVGRVLEIAGLDQVLMIGE